MPEMKNSLPEIRIYAPTDLSKNWFIHFKNQAGKRQKKYGKINNNE